MKFGSNCSGPCSNCKTNFIGGCLAGHGDDEYVYADDQWLVDRYIELRKQGRYDRFRWNLAVGMLDRKLVDDREAKAVIQECRMVAEAERKKREAEQEQSSKQWDALIGRMAILRAIAPLMYLAWREDGYRRQIITEIGDGLEQCQ